MKNEGTEEKTFYQTETQPQGSGNVFGSRNFRLVFFGALVSELGSGLYSFAVSFYILEITGNNAFLQGLYLALCGVMLLLFTPVGGVLGDRFNKAKIMYVCDYIKGALILLATVLMVLFTDRSLHIPILFAVGGLGNAVSGIFSPAAGALFPHIVEDDKLQQANSYFTVKSSLLGIFGVVLAGIMYAAMPVQLLFSIVGICYVLSGVSEMFIRYAHTPGAEKLTLGLALKDMGEGLHYLKMQKAIMALMIAILFINFFFAPVSSNFIPYFIKTDVAGAPAYLFDGILTPELWSSVFSVAIGISSLVSSAILSTRKQADKCGRTVAGYICAIAVVMIGMTVSYHYFVAAARSLNVFLVLMTFGTFVLGYLLPCINIPINTAFMRIIDRDKLSKVSSITSVCSQGLIPIATVIAGVILQYLSSTVLLIVCAAGFTATALFLLFNKQVAEI